MWTTEWKLTKKKQRKEFWNVTRRNSLEDSSDNTKLKNESDQKKETKFQVIFNINFLWPAVLDVNLQRSKSTRGPVPLDWETKEIRWNGDTNSRQTVQ